MRLKKIFTLALIMGLTAPFGLFAAQVFESSQEAPALLELYSSQECKECPSAEAWMAGLNSRKDLWKAVIPMIFHVNYGADLGEDTLAVRDHDLRLKKYLDAWKSTALILPLMVLDGKPFEYSADFSKDLNISHPSAGKLTVKVLDEREFLILYKPTSNLADRELEIHGALLGFATSSDASENKVMAAFTVLSYRKKTVQSENGNYSTSLILPSQKKSFQLTAVSFWVTEMDGMTVLQAVGGGLSSGE